MTFSFALPSELPRHNTGCFMGLRLTVLSKLIAVSIPKSGVMESNHRQQPDIRENYIAVRITIMILFIRYSTTELTPDNRL